MSNDDSNKSNSSNENSLSQSLTDLVSQRPSDRDEFFKFLGVPLQNYDLNMSTDVAVAFKNSIISLKTGLHAKVPMICPGGKMCPVGRQCDFTVVVKDIQTGRPKLGSDRLPIIDMQASVWPIGKPCPYDTALISMRIRDLCEEYGVDPA